MHQISSRALLFVIVGMLSFSCVSTKKVTQNEGGISKIKFLGTYNIPFNLQFNGTTVGGLSGIDYDAVNNKYYIISDDRSDKNPARFYTAKIFVRSNGIDSLVFTGVKNLLQPNGDTFPGTRQNKQLTPDPEGIRYNSKTRRLVWSSEGERILKDNDTVRINPAISVIDTKGNYIANYVLPENMHMSVLPKGPRRNGVFEGLTFAENFKTLFVSVEEPLYEDGPQADVFDNNACVRIIKFNAATKKSIAQFAYKLEPVAYAPIPAQAFKINGVPDILSVGNNKLLVIERSFSTGRLPCTIKLFIADCNEATDITNTGLKGKKDFIPAKKTLLLNMDELGIYTDNIEGVTFGPVLPNGHRTLLFIADDNFTLLQRSQVLLFEILE